MNIQNYKHAVACNNQAVAFLQQGVMSTALTLFRTALQTTVTLLDQAPATATNESSAACQVQVSFHTTQSSAQEPQSQPQEEQSASYRQPSCEPERETRNATSGHNSGCSPCSMANMDQESSLEYAFFRALNIIPAENAYAEDPLLNLSIVSAIVLFNIGIVYHKVGLMTTSSELQALSHLKKAQSLYAKAQGLLREVGVSVTESHNHPVIDIVNMAIYNNMAQCSYMQTNYMESSYNFELVVHYARSVMPEHHDGDTAQLLQWHKSFFLLNAFALQPPSAASAA